jgi:biopolymer transport protein ExbD
MAEIIDSQKQIKGKRLIRKSTRVDLTPMVDLGFLLITFFVFTTTMSTTKAMSMVSPKEDIVIKDKVCESCVITVLPAANNKLYYYEGTGKNAVFKTTSYSADGLRALLVNKKNYVDAMSRDAILIIKPGMSSTFKNLINIIDESNICMYKRYYLDKASAADERIIKQ